MKKTKKDIDISVLYKLSLSIATTLDLNENCSTFLKVLVEELNLNSASIWLDSNWSKKIGKGSYVHVSSYPFTIKENNQQDIIPIEWNILPEEDPFLELRDRENVYLKRIIGDEKTNRGTCILYEIINMGILELYFPHKLETNSSIIDLTQLKQVIEKLATSIQACIQHQNVLRDAKARVLMEEKFTSSEEKYKTVVENISEGLVITDPEDNLIFVNGKMTTFSGFQVEEVIGRRACDVYVPKEFWGEYRDKILRRKRGEADQYEITLKRKDNTLWFASVSASPYRNSEGKIVGTIAAIVDISKQKDMELAVLRSEEKYRSIIENMELGLLEVDLDDRIIKAYPKFCKLTGYNEDELIGKIASEIFIDKEDEELQLMEKEVNARKKGESGVYELQMRKKNGERIWVMISGAAYYDYNGNIAGSVGIHLDITKRKKVEQDILDSQQKLKLILDTSLDAIVMIDQESCVTDWNHNAEKIFGYDKSEVLGKKLGKLIIPHRMRAQHEKGMSHFMKTGEGPVLEKRIELPALRKTGEEFPVEISISPIKIADGYYFSAFIRDITVRKANENALIDAKQTADHARQAERQFLAHMSHEIRTPMNAVIGMTHLLMKSGLTSTQKDYVQALKFSGDSLMNIISDILDLSKIEAGELTLDNRPFSIHKLIYNLQRTYQYKVQEKNVSVTIFIDESILNQVIGDETRLNQILSNLLGNASKFTDEGYIGVSVFLKEKINDTYWVRFEIHDTGIGIAKENIDRIFKSFKQAGASIHNQFGGTGLGLSIVRQLVELHHGEIDVESTIGKGSIFKITIPLKDAGIPIEMEKNVVDENKERLTTIQNLNILVAEDHPINQKLITTILEEWEAKYDLVSNGEEAFQKACLNKYDFVLMDINMPKMNGYEATKLIRKKLESKNQKTPILALTAAALKKEQKRMLEVGANDFLTKPFSPKQLQDTILNHINNEVETVEQIKPSEDKEGGDTLHFNLEYLEKFSRNNPMFIIEMLEMFLEENPKNIKLLEKYYEEQHWENLAGVAHRMKATYSALGLFDAGKRAETLEVHIKEELVDPIFCKNHVEELSSFSLKIYPLIQTKIEGLKDP